MIGTVGPKQSCSLPTGRTSVTRKRHFCARSRGNCQRRPSTAERWPAARCSSLHSRPAPHLTTRDSRLGKSIKAHFPNNGNSVNARLHPIVINKPHCNSSFLAEREIASRPKRQLSSSGGMSRRQNMQLPGLGVYVFVGAATDSPWNL